MIIPNFNSQCEQHDHPRKIRNHCRCIDGTITGSNKCVGFCDYYGHRGFLTKETRKKHDCLKKECAYYVAKKEYLYKGGLV